MKSQKLFPWKLFSKIAVIQATLILLCIGITGFTTRQYFKQQFFKQVEHQLNSSLQSLSHNLSKYAEVNWCSNHSKNINFRLTVIHPTGRVICDSHHAPNTMDNHIDRPEVKNALLFNRGQVVRYSTTVNQDLFYLALNLKEESLILRGAVPLSYMNETIQWFDRSLLMILAFITFIFIACTIWSSRALAVPFGALIRKAKEVIPQIENSEQPKHKLYDELSELEISLDQIRHDLESKAESLSQERAEQAALISAISDAIVAVDLDGLPLFYNSSFAVLFSNNNNLHLSKTKLNHLIKSQVMLDAFNNAQLHGWTGLVNDATLELGQNKKHFSLSVAPLRRSNNNQIYGAVGVFHDITELKKSDQIRIDFVANVSHELRTPLTSIKGYADTLLQDHDSGRGTSKEFLEIISRNSSRLMSLINDLLDLSSLDANADDLQKTLIATDDFSSRIVKQMQRMFESKKQSLIVETNVDKIYADTRRLEQVLVNLLDNASKYSPMGGSITLKWESDGKNSVDMKVKDSGPGIPVEHHQRLFERFYRVDKARSRELGGTGLGLAIAKHIMQRHGGFIWVESTPPHGAEFICKFPNAENEERA